MWPEVPTIVWVMIAGYLWTIPWKGVALWKSARRGHRTWFIVLLILGMPTGSLHFFGIPDILYIFVFADRRKNTAQPTAGMNTAVNKKGGE